MQTIGFTNEYFTLWNVSEVYKVPVNANQWYEAQDFIYVQNLSKTLEGAKAKLQGAFDIDLELRGSSTFVKKSELLENFEVWQFTFGKLIGSDIRTCDDVWQLERAMDSEKGEDRKEIAKQRLIELGEVIQFDGNWIKKSELEYRTEQKRKATLNNGHFFTDGEKITVDVQLEEQFSFDTQFGTCYIDIFRTADGKLLKYKGSNPPQLMKRDEEGNREYSEHSTYTFTGTVKHTEYNGQAETHLQRIKVIKIQLPKNETEKVGA